MGDDERVREVCEAAVRRLDEQLSVAEVACLLRYDDVLRHVAHAGGMRLIYEIPHEWGGVIWRAFDREETQLVKDVRSDADYLSQDEAVRAEIAAPVRARGKVVGVLNVESRDNLDERDAELVEREAERLGRELAEASVSTRS